MESLYILNEIYTNGFNYFFLNVISLFSVSCGILVIIAKNPILSVLFLISLFFSVASYLIMLGINFIGLSYLLVYVGAVSILFLFILMLINVRISELVTNNRNSFFLAVIIGIYLLVPVYYKGNTSQDMVSWTFQDTIQNTENNDYSILTGKTNNYVLDPLNKIYALFKENIYFTTSQTWDGALGEMSHITNIGSIIYTNYPIWLILTSIILLLAMVGAIVITIKQ